MKILNLYAGIGGNRKLWGEDHEIVAIEWNQQIADIYKRFFPKDNIIVCDAHKYLLEHFNEFDFIWASPPCPTHSRVRKLFHTALPIYPNMALYEEVLLLEGYANCKWVVENVISWYEPLIKPCEIAKHYIWSNFYIAPYSIETREHFSSVEDLQKLKGFNLDNSGLTIGEKILALRNCVEPALGLYLFQQAFKGFQSSLSLEIDGHQEPQAPLAELGK